MNFRPPQRPGADPPSDFRSDVPDDPDVRVCYRHPDRETRVSCSNCGRPICHECMIPAAVGFRCPECVREQQARGQRARVVTRAQTRTRWESGMLGAGGSVTRILVAVNVVIFLIGLLGIDRLLGFSLLEAGALAPVQVLVGHEYWRMLTSMFLHYGLLHIMFNMWALWVIGGYVERILGSARFAALYFLSGFAGSVLIVVATPIRTPTVGASGAIFGVFGALAVYAYLNRHRDHMARAMLNQIVFLLVLNLMITFWSRAISWQAHVGGLIAGAAMTAVLLMGGRRHPRGRLERIDFVVFAVAAAVLLAVTWWRVTSFGPF